MSHSRPCQCDQPGCPLCARFRDDPRYAATWSGQDAKPAGNRIARYARAVARWVRAGRPERTSDEIAAVLKICAGDPATNSPKCPHYAENRCTKCGCRLAGASGFVSKITMATEHCPVQKW